MRLGSHGNAVGGERFEVRDPRAELALHVAQRLDGEFHAKPDDDQRGGELRGVHRERGAQHAVAGIVALCRSPRR
jgi:hypothetical protein